MADLVLGAGGAAATAYTVDQSLRFNSGDNPMLSRTPGSASNRKTWTYSLWFKKDTDNGSSESPTLLYAGDESGSAAFQMYIIHSAGHALSDKLFVYQDSTVLETDQLFRDPSAWYHIVLAVDTTQDVSSDRVKLYVNGDQVTAFDTASYPSEDADWDVNNNNIHVIGSSYYSSSVSESIGGYLAEVYLIDGLQLAADSFGETDSDTNQWKPIDASGLTFGTNGFYQKYAGTMDGYTKLLLHCDGANDGTTFTDSSPSAHTMTANGDAHTDTAVKKFGTASAQFDGTGDSISCADDSDFNFASGDFTVEMWIRRTSNSSGNQEMYYGQHQDGNNKIHFYDNGNGTLYWNVRSGGATRVYDWTSSAVLSVDTWHHVAWVRNGSTFKVYVDGTEPATNGYDPFDNGAFPDLTGDVHIGGNGVEITRFPGYVDEVRVSKGIARYTAAFTVATEPFGDTSIGADSSGNDNTFTATNLVATDKMVDSPTNNFCTLNPLESVGSGHAYSFQEGNLQLTNINANVCATFGFGNGGGKYYWEYYYVSNTGDLSQAITVQKDGISIQNTFAVGMNVLFSDGHTWTDGSEADGFDETIDPGDIVQVKLDLDGGTLQWGKNNTFITAITLPSSAGGWRVGGMQSSGSGATQVIVANYGQDSSFAGNKTAQGNQDDNSIGDFFYDVPAGFLAPCSSNLPDPEIKLPSENFNTLLWTGTGGARDFTGVGFQPDLVWCKARDEVQSYNILDSLRGGGKTLASNTTNADTDNYGYGYIDSFDTDGFSTTTGEYNNYAFNKSSATYVAWNWLAGTAPTADNSAGAGATPTAGSVKIDGSNLGSALAGTIAATRLSANTTSGFSIVSYSGNETTTQTVAHGLSSAPSLVIVKNLGYTTEWAVGSDAETSWSYYLYLNDSRGQTSASSVFGNAPDASVFKIGDATATNGAYDYIAYCFSNIEGYTKVGKYTGNVNADGTFAYLGFRPAMILIKGIGYSSDWHIFDNKRIGYNVANYDLTPSENVVETTDVELDFVSNGFKIRTSAANINSGGSDLLYYAISEFPFKYANAR